MTARAWLQRALETLGLVAPEEEAVQVVEASLDQVMQPMQAPASFRESLAADLSLAAQRKKEDVIVDPTADVTPTLLGLGVGIILASLTLLWWVVRPRSAES